MDVQRCRGLCAALVGISRSDAGCVKHGVVVVVVVVVLVVVLVCSRGLCEALVRSTCAKHL